MIGERIMKLRKKKNITLTQLANDAGVSKSYLSNIERGIQENPSIKFLSTIADCFEISLEELLKPTKSKIPTKKLDPEWISFILEVQKYEITIEEFKSILEYIKFKRNKKNE